MTIALEHIQPDDWAAVNRVVDVLRSLVIDTGGVSLSIRAGTVSAAGAVVRGQGFTSAKTATGTYTVTQTWARAPVVVVTVGSTASAAGMKVSTRRPQPALGSPRSPRQAQPSTASSTGWQSADGGLMANLRMAGRHEGPLRLVGDGAQRAGRPPKGARPRSNQARQNQAKQAATGQNPSGAPTKGVPRPRPRFRAPLPGSRCLG
jgi:hypothetical protein